MMINLKRAMYGALMFAVMAGGMFFAPTAPAHADLLITPLQVVIEGRERKAEVVLVNTSANTNTYRLIWRQLTQVEGLGGYVEVSEEDRKTRLDVEDFVVYTPRQITLGPNEKQTIRLAVRRPKDLAEGEYKSHLKFSIVPTLSVKAEVENDVGDQETGFGAKVFASYSIPIIYRVGDYDMDIELGQPELVKNEKTSTVSIKLPVSRSGKHGVVGLLEAFFKPDGGEEITLGVLSGSSLSPEISNRTFTIITRQPSLPSGELRIVFKKAEGHVNDYTVLTEKTYPIGR